MSREMQNIVGGILLIICLGALEWWEYKNGVSTGPRLLFPRLAAYRETDPRRFWFNILFYCVVILIFAGMVLYNLSELPR
jgi:hypothetical protein